MRTAALGRAGDGARLHCSLERPMVLPEQQSAFGSAPIYARKLTAGQFFARELDKPSIRPQLKLILPTRGWRH